ncbi:unnamed protein product [Ilex paraguariensis]|uniref:Uncharacterized protein n=1 Tax=Ilex paraguariensis TaxID=185542 RepID=A0ABC8RVP3_9AQUA
MALGGMLPVCCGLLPYAGLVAAFLCFSDLLLVWLYAAVLFCAAGLCWVCDSVDGGLCRVSSVLVWRAAYVLISGLFSY